MSLKSNVTAGLVVALLAVVVAPIATSTPVEAQDQTSWYVNDDPSLYGPSRYWWWGDAGKGYGSNNYRFTFGSGGESGPENWARWSMGRRVGRQEIQVYVPNTKATATVVYRIGVGGREYTRQVAQRNAYGWTSLGNYDTDGANVTIMLRDNEAAQHWDRHGYDASRIGVDAARMRCITRCSTHSNPPPPPPPPPPPLAERQVTLALGDDVGDSTLCLKDHLPCRWLNITLENFPAGSYWLLGLRQKFSYSEDKEFDGRDCAGYLATSDQNPAHFGRSCYFNGQPGRYLHVTVDGVKSNTIRLSGNNVASRPPPPPPPPPSPPERQVVISLGDDRNSDRNRMCPYGGLPCRWVNVTLKNFPEGRYWVRCVWQKTTSGSESVPIRNYINHDGRSSAGLNRFCSFNVQPIRHLHVTIDGVKSNTIRMSGSNVASPSPLPPPPPPVGDPPGRPGLDVSVDSWSDGSRKLVASWSPPSDDGGSPITGYTVTISRPGKTFGPYNRSASSRYLRLSDARSDTAYTVRVVAKNRHGSSPEARRSITTSSVQPCTGVTLVWARGSGKKPRLASSDNGSGTGAYDWEGELFESEFENHVGEGAYYFYELASGNHGYSIEERYPAIDVDGITMLAAGLGEGNDSWPAQYKELRGGRAYSYVESVYEGMQELGKYLDNRAAQCPEERFVLAGYSQGAHVISKALSGTVKALKTLEGTSYRSTLDSYGLPNSRLIRGRVAFVALFGDPTFVCREGEDKGRRSWIYGNPPKCPFDGILASFEEEEGRLGYLPEDLKSRAGSWCDSSDHICTGKRREWLPIFGGHTHDKYGNLTHTKADGKKTWIEEGAEIAALNLWLPGETE